MDSPQADLDRVFEAALAAAGYNRAKAVSWFHETPLDAFGGKTPATLVSESRADDVLAYIDSLANGPAG
jgi:hypothetical protein